MNARDKEKIVDEHLGLVYFALKKIKFPQNMYEDLVQEGTLGLLKAGERFDKSKGMEFSTFALSYIEGYILRSMKKFDVNRPVRLPEYLYQRGLAEEKGIKVSSYDKEIPTLEGRVVTFIHVLASKIEARDLGYMRLIIKKLMQCLSDRERKAIYLKFFQGYSYREMGVELEMSFQGAAAMVKTALKKMRKKAKWETTKGEII